MRSLFDFNSESAYWSHWQWYKKFFGDAAFKALVAFISLLPVISKVFMTREQAKDTGFVLETQLRSLFSWQYLWLAGALYFIAYLLYIFFCPDFIKKYNNYKEYSDYEHNPRWIVWLSQEIIDNRVQLKEFFSRMKSKKYFALMTDTPEEQPTPDESKVEVREKQTVIFFVNGNDKYQFGMPILDSQGKLDKDATASAVNDIFWEIFGRFATIRMWARVAIMVLLFLSLGMFGVIVAQYFVSMIKYIF